MITAVSIGDLRRDTTSWEGSGLRGCLYVVLSRRRNGNYRCLVRRADRCAVTTWHPGMIEMDELICRP